MTVEAKRIWFQTGHNKRVVNIHQIKYQNCSFEYSMNTENYKLSIET